MDDKILFNISVYSSFVICHFKCPFKFLKLFDSGWLFFFFISWKKRIMKVIPIISFLCAVIIIAVTLTLFAYI